MEKKEITNKPKDEVTNKPKEIKIEISCEIVDDGKTPKKEFSYTPLLISIISFVAIIPSGFINDILPIFFFSVCFIAFLKASDNELDRKIKPEKYK